MNVAVQIRRAEAGDAIALTDVAFAAKRHWDYPEEWIRLWADELTVDPEYIGTHQVYVAEDDTGVVGWCAVSEDADACWLDYCWVRPEAAGRGTGKLLVQQARAIAADSRAGALKVISDPNAQGFYARLGFRRIGEHPSKPEGRSLPVLKLSLSP